MPKKIWWSWGRKNQFRQAAKVNAGLKSPGRYSKPKWPVRKINGPSSEKLSKSAQKNTQKDNNRDNLLSAVIHGLFRPSVSQILVSVVICVVVAGFIWQIKQNQESDTYSSYRRSDLIQVLDQLETENNRLAKEVSELEETKRELESGVDSRRVAIAESQKRLDSLAILAGTAKAWGPGINLTIHDPQENLTAANLLDAIGELRDAGAEAIEVNDEIRIAGQSWVTGQNGKLEIDGKQVQTPITIDVIGDPHSLEQGVRFRGGLVWQVESEKVGGSVQIFQSDKIVIDSTRPGVELKFGQPVQS